MTTVLLEGRLGQIVGRDFSFKARTLREVLNAIEANTGKLRSYLHQNGKRAFAVFVNGKELEGDVSLNIKVENKKIVIIPLLMGAFVAIFTKFVVTKILKLSVASMAGKIATFVVGTVLSAALSFGISLLIAKLMKPDDPDLANTTSFAFGQAENVTRQGVVVPVGYGRLQVGSRVVSVNMFNVDRSKFENQGAQLQLGVGGGYYFNPQYFASVDDGYGATDAIQEGQGGFLEVDTTGGGGGE